MSGVIIPSAPPLESLIINDNYLREFEENLMQKLTIEIRTKILAEMKPLTLDELNNKLFLACKTGNYVEAKEALDKGADSNVKFDNVTGLIWASARGYVKIVEELIKAGACCDATTVPNGTTALYNAIVFNRIEVVELLLEKGNASVKFASLDSKETPLITASLKGRLEIIKILLKNGANVNAPNKDGRFTPLMLAARGGHIEIFKYLVSQGANIRYSAAEGRSAIGMARLNGHTDIVNFIHKSVK